MTPFEVFLLELAKVLQFSTLAPDAKGACLIIMKEGNIPLLFEWDEQLVPNTILLSCLVCQISMERRCEVYEACLMGNESIEETLSVKPDEDLVYLHRRFHPSIQQEDLGNLLKRFLENLKLWREKIDQLTKEPSQTDLLPHHPASIQVFPYKA